MHRRYDSGVSGYAIASVETLLAVLHAELPTLRKFGVVRIGIFGSRVRGSGGADSDLDVLVELGDHRDLLDLIAVKQHLESVLGVAVDATTPSGLRESCRQSILDEVRYAT